MPVGGDGVVRFDETQLKPSLSFVAVQMVNHETGAIQPVREIAARLPKAVRLHTDAAQAVGKIPVDFRELGATSLAASAHKFRGPAGIGLLLLRRGTSLRPQVFGGHQQQGRRPGTESVLLAVGMAAALDHAVRLLNEHHEKLISLRERFLDRLTSHESTFALNSPPDAFPGCLSISFPGCRGDLLMMALDLAGVACSTGSACSSGSLLPSPVLQAMGVPDDVLRSAIRFSFGPELDLETMSEAADRVAKVVKKLRDG
jgi:cysteine desulfurase